MATWEQQKKYALETANREIPRKTVELNEFPQKFTAGKSRGTPSLWSHGIIDAPASVEEATAKYFRHEGWIVSPTLFKLLSLFGIVEALASLGEEGESIFNKLLNNLLFYPEICQILRSNKPSKSEKFEYWLQRVYSLKNGVHEFNSLHILDPIFPKEHENKFTDQESKDNEIDFIKRLYRLSPRQTWQTAYLINRERLRKHGSFAGVPDLLIWNDETYNMVEVKSPNDNLQLSQAFFYCTVAKPLCINIFIADVIPSRGRKE